MNFDSVQNVYLRSTRPKYYMIYSAAGIPQTPERHFDGSDDAVEWATGWASGFTDYCLNIEINPKERK